MIIKIMVNWLANEFENCIVYIKALTIACNFYLYFLSGCRHPLLLPDTQHFRCNILQFYTEIATLTNRPTPLFPEHFWPKHRRNLVFSWWLQFVLRKIALTEAYKCNYFFPIKFFHDAPISDKLDEPARDPLGEESALFASSLFLFLFLFICLIFSFLLPLTYSLASTINFYLFLLSFFLNWIKAVESKHFPLFLSTHHWNQRGLLVADGPHCLNKQCVLQQVVQMG